MNKCRITDQSKSNYFFLKQPVSHLFSNRSNHASSWMSAAPAKPYTSDITAHSIHKQVVNTDTAMLPSVMFSSFSKSKGVKMSMKWTMFSNGSSRYWLISLKNARLMSSWEIGVAGSPLFGWYGVYCIRQFMMWYPSGARVLSKTDGIVISKKGFRLILFSKVFCIKVGFVSSLKELNIVHLIWRF